MKLGKIIQVNTTYQPKLIQELKFSTLKICHAKFHENGTLKHLYTRFPRVCILMMNLTIFCFFNRIRNNRVITVFVKINLIFMNAPFITCTS